MNLRILVIGSETYKNAFVGLPGVEFGFYNSYATDLVDRLPYFDLVCFTGGHDVHPDMYGEVSHISTSSSLERDTKEARIFMECVKRKIPMIGICRGSQFLTVMNGGKLIQNITNHALSSGHQIEAHLPGKSGQGKIRLQFHVSSTHHQMMYPFNLDKDKFEVLGFAKGLSSKYEGLPECELKAGIFNTELVADNNRKGVHAIEPEVVYYPGSNSLAVQYHPEMMTADSKGVEYFQAAMWWYLFGKTFY